MKDFFGEMKNLLLYAGVGKEAAERVQERADMENDRNLFVAAVVSMIYFGACFVAGFFDGQLHTRQAGYASGWVISIVIYFVHMIASHRSRAVQRILVNSFEFLMLLSALYLSVFGAPNSMTVMLCCFFILMPTLFTDVPYKLGILYLIVDFIYLMEAPLLKVPNILMADTFSVLIYSSLGFLFGTRVCRVRYERFTLQDAAYRKAQDESREESREELEQAYEKASRASDAKTRFLFNMSHDIRTPMNAIMGYTRLARRVEDNPAKTREYLEKMSMAQDNLLRLIDNVLELSSIENGTIASNPIPNDLSMAMEKTLTVFRPLAREKHIELTGRTEILHPYLFEDESMDAQIALNIVNNALKYTPAGGHVELTLTELPSTDPDECILRFRCRDDGVGMSKEFLAHASDRFTREKNETTSHVSGAGVGLAIAKELIEFNRGTIDIQSEQGKGTIVSVFTHHKFATQEQVHAYARDEMFGAPSLVGRRILLAEDNELNREITVELMKEIGAETETAEDGQVAVNLMKDKPAGYYDLILMDIQMPFMDGYEATRTIRGLKDRKKAEIPIVALTANTFANDRAMAFESGMNGFVPKPIRVTELLDVLVRVMS